MRAIGESEFAEFSIFQEFFAAHYCCLPILSAFGFEVLDYGLRGGAG
jgi:hypothetical protein